MRDEVAIRRAALDWIRHDPDPATRDELRTLLDTDPGGNELAERMAGPVRFGTAGLRAPVRAGPNGMNVAVVRRVSAALAEWLVRGGEAGAPVVVGRDARHGSAEFAEATAAVLAGAGFRVTVLRDPLPTPVLAYAVRALDAAAGVQITASHNPPADNGYKVYLGGPDAGAQLVEPADRQIEALITSAPVAVRIPAVAVAYTNPSPLVAGYLARTARLARPGPAAWRPRIALTALHGVGNDLAVRALATAGFPDVHVVAEQARPDPDFPTVRFPNPEEPGATDALLALAAEVDADLAIALDPDADRCALGIPDRTTGWRMLTGNETGALLGEHLLRTLDRAGQPDPLVTSTVASSRLLRSIAVAHGARFTETLTGFKWIVRAGRTGPPDPGFVYGFEEALGYCVDPATVRDKDGIAAAVLAADLRATTGPLDAVLDELALAHGLHLTTALTVRVDARRRAELVARLAERFGGPAPDVFVLERPGARAVIRPSGTEPKLKAYLEAVEPVAGRADLAGARNRASQVLTLLTSEVNGLLGADVATDR